VVVDLPGGREPHGLRTASLPYPTGHCGKGGGRIVAGNASVTCADVEGHAPSWPRMANNGRTRRSASLQKAHVTEALLVAGAFALTPAPLAGYDSCP